MWGSSGRQKDAQIQDLKREFEMQLNKLQDEQECVSSLTKEVEEARRAAGTAEQEAEQRGKDVERLREEITGLELVVADMKMLQAKGSQGQRELEMQLYKLQAAQECVSSLAIEVEETLSAAGTAEQEAEQLAKDVKKLSEKTHWLEQAVGDMKRNHSAALAGKEVQIAEMHKAKANLERKRSEDQLRMIERVTKQASTRYARMIA